ncbi:hypothetical protein ACFY9A_26470 [Streptomyces rubradiris]|uniref:hypothetical protein n=1 Tax=Streptomyces rubradiris TaxID=285531 RepID=UPI0036F02563
MADKQNSSRPPSEAGREAEQTDEEEGKRKGQNWPMYSFFINAARFVCDRLDEN